MTERQFRRRLAGVAAAGFAWRLWYLVGWKFGDSQLADEGDALYYAGQAIVNAQGHLFDHPFTGEAAADHPPLTSLLLTPVAWLSGDRIGAMRLFMAFCGTATVVVVGLLGRAVAGRTTGLVAAALAAGNASFWTNDGLVMSESPSTLLLAAFLLAAWRAWPAPSRRDALVLGLLTGLGVLARAEVALLVPLVVLPLFLRRTAPGPDGARDWRSAALAVGLAGAVVLPWTAWNATRFEEPVLLSTNDGLTIAGANCDTTWHRPAIGFWSLQCGLDVPGATDPDLDQSERSAALRRAGLDYLRAHLERLPVVVAARLGRVWGLYEPRQMVYLNDGEGRETWASWVAMAQFWVLAPLAVAGALLLRRRRRPVWPLLATVVQVTATAALFYGIVRFRIAADLAVTVLAAVALVGLLERRGDRRPAGAAT